MPNELPWERYDETAAALAEAKASWEHLSDADREKILGPHAEAADRLLRFAALVFRAAAGLLADATRSPLAGYVTDDVKKRLAYMLGSDLALEEATEAKAEALAVADQVRALVARLAAVERKVDDLTPGVGEPGRTR